jgi:serine/threonine protein kinase/tetratricopeptide (TPR) repeat protein
MKSVEKLPSRYKIADKLGEGGFGEVYKAYDSHLKQTIAIKILPDQAASEQETLTREFKTLSQLQHPNLVKVFDYGILPPRAPYFTMELIEGQNVREFLRNKRNVILLPAIIRQVLNALAYLHKSRILHGDIKPENIVIIENEDHSVTAKLLDFGLTTSLGDESKLVSGTLRYLAPEILLYGSPSSPATDLYALGVSLIEATLSEEVPSANEIDEAFLESAYAELNMTLTSAGIRNPSALTSFILDLCKPDPSDRIQDAKEANQLFEMIAAELVPRHEIQMNDIFIGRSKDLEDIGEYLAGADSTKRVIILSGPRGIGKKSIAGKAAQSAQLKGFLPIDLTPSASYFSLDQLVDTLSSHLSTTEKKLFSSKLAAPSKSGDKHENADIDPNRASVIYAHIIQFLVDMSASRRILIMASDIERSSEDFLLFTLQLIRQLETSESRITMLITLNARPASQNQISATLSRIVDSKLSATIEVQPFDDKLLKQYLIAHFGQTLLPEMERRDLISKTQGLPLLIAAFLKSLLTANVIQNEEGHWILDRRLYKQKHVPSDADDYFSIAIRDLPEDQMALLRLIALYGQTIKPEQLAVFSRGFIKDPLRAIGGLVTRAILMYRGDGEISVAHPLYAQLVIERIPPNLMRDYSGLLADSLVSGGSNDSLRIAQLSISAERVNEALKYGFEAVDKMYSSYLLYDCLKLLLDLKNLALRMGSKAQLLDVLNRLAPVEHQTGLPREAIEDYLTLASYAHDEAQKVHYYLQLAEIQYRLLGNIEKSQAMLKKALRSASRSAKSDQVAAVYQGLAALSPKKSIPFYEKAAALSRNTNVNLYLTSLAHLVSKYHLAGKPQRASKVQQMIISQINKANLATRKEIYFFLYWFEFLTGNYKAARFYIMKKIQLEKRTEDSLELTTSMSDLGGCFYTEGSFYKMIDALKEAYNIAIRYNKYLSAITILSNLSLAFRTIADYGQSLNMLYQAEEIIKQENIQVLNSAFLNKPTMLYVMLGKHEESEFKLRAQRLHERAKRTNNHIGAGHYSMAFAMYHMNRLQANEALNNAKKALFSFKKAADKDDIVLSLAHVAIIQIALGKPKQARASLKQAEEIYEAIHCEYLKPLLMLGKAMLARSERSENSRKVLNDALKTSKKMGTREITWQIQREFALYHRDRGELHKALAHYKDAVETIKQITETIDEEEIKMSYLEVPFRNRVFDEIRDLKREAPKTQ